MRCIILWPVLCLGESRVSWLAKRYITFRIEDNTMFTIQGSLQILSDSQKSALCAYFVRKVLASPGRESLQSKLCKQAASQER